VMTISFGNTWKSGSVARGTLIEIPCAHAFSILRFPPSSGARTAQTHPVPFSRRCDVSIGVTHRTLKSRCLHFGRETSARWLLSRHLMLINSHVHPRVHRRSGSATARAQSSGA
jgi:hypothetical protein